MHRPDLFANECHLRITHIRDESRGVFCKKLRRSATTTPRAIRKTLEYFNSKAAVHARETHARPRAIAAGETHLCVRIADALSLVQNTVVPVARQKKRLQRLHPLV